MPDGYANKASAWRWVIPAGVMLALILVPFGLMGQRIEDRTIAFVEAARSAPGAAAWVLGGLLASDILFPVPSSLVSTACGALLGFWPGLLVSALGMTFSCMAGYLLGRWGRGVTGRWVGAGEMARLERLHSRWGLWILAVTRPVPVLAEAAVLFAGISRFPWTRFAVLTTLSNLGVSAVYAAVGAWSSTRSSFLFAFAGALLLPMVFIAGGRWMEKDRGTGGDRPEVL